MSLWALLSLCMFRHCRCDESSNHQSLLGLQCPNEPIWQFINELKVSGTVATRHGGWGQKETFEKMFCDCRDTSSKSKISRNHSSANNGGPKISTQDWGKYERQEKPNQIYERQESHFQLTSNIIMARTGALCVWMDTWLGVLWLPLSVL